MASLLVEDPSEVREMILNDIPRDEPSVKTSTPLPGTQKPGYSPIYRNSYFKKGLLSNLHPSMNTVYHLFEHAVKNVPKRDAFGTRVKYPDGSFGPYKFQSYETIARRAANLGSGFLFVLRNNPHKDPETNFNTGNDVGESGNFIITIFSANRAEWCITDLATSSYSLTNTALYDTLGAGTSTYILSLTESPLIVCSKDKLRKLIELKKTNPKELAKLITIVSMEKLQLDDPLSSDYELKALAEDAKLTLFDFGTVEKLGEINRVPQVPPKPETVYTISFTSGTTGAHPKGVVLSHDTAAASVCFGVLGTKIFEHPVSYSFLPLAHIYERMAVIVAYATAGSIGFPQSASPLTLIDDIKALRPHQLTLVPRVFTRLEAALKAQTINNHEKPILQKLFSNAINKKMELQALRDGAEGHHFFYDRLTSILRRKLGMDRVILLTSGSAPISKDTLRFLKATLDTGMRQGYGLTESFAGICASGAYDANPGSCGPIGPTVEMRLRELPEMGYTAGDEGGPRGELLLRGPQVFKEYFKNPEETSKAFDEEGWFKTGDVAKFDENGLIYIIDRVKNFFKLAQGEYITPEKIENTFLSSFPDINQLYVHGDSLKTFLVAIVGINPDTISPFIKRNYGKNISKEEAIHFLNQHENKVTFLKLLNQSNKTLQKFEYIHNVEIDLEPLTVDRDVVTPTMKIKRPLAAKFFADVFDRLYAEGSLIKQDEASKL